MYYRHANILLFVGKGSLTWYCILKSSSAFILSICTGDLDICEIVSPVCISQVCRSPDRSEHTIRLLEHTRHSIGWLSPSMYTLLSSANISVYRTCVKWWWINKCFVYICKDILVGQRQIHGSLAMVEISVVCFTLFTWWRVYEGCSQTCSWTSPKRFSADVHSTLINYENTIAIFSFQSYHHFYKPDGQLLLNLHTIYNRNKNFFLHRTTLLDSNIFRKFI